MKRFLITFTVFAVVLFSIALSLDLFISWRLKNTPNFAVGEAAVWNDIYNGNVQADIVVYGSSRAWLHIDPNMLSEAFARPCYNLGIDGHSFSLQYFRHQALIQYNQQPSLILLSVDINTFDDSEEFYNIDQFMPWMLFDGSIAAQTSQYKGSPFLFSIIPALRYAGQKQLLKEVFHLKKGQHIFHRVKGYQGMEWTWNDDLDNAKLSRESITASVDSSLIRLFEKFLTECRFNKTKVIIVYSPEYIEGQNFITNRRELIDTFTGLSKRYTIPFYDYSGDTLSYQQKYFYNSMHLNKQGSALFTKKLIADIKNDKQVLQGL